MFSAQYIAGFFDGEGMVAVYPNGGTNSSYRLVTTIAQNATKQSKKMFEWLKQTFGGEYNVVKNRHGISYNYYLSSKDAVIFLLFILPYLSLKKFQVQIALIWYLSIPNQKRRVDGTTISGGSGLSRPDGRRKLDKIVYKKLRALKKERI